MARYIGPKIKISRHFGQKLGLRTNEEAFTRRSYKPGEHGNRRRSNRLSKYGEELQEKQKAKHIYGILERQFHRYYKQASKSENAGLRLLQMLETRLDSAVFRGGLALTQSQARQLVSHGHVLVNGKKVSIPSFAVIPGMKITLAPELHKTITDSGTATPETPNWLKRDDNAIEVLALPTREEITPLIEERLIIEYYSR